MKYRQYIPFAGFLSCPSCNHRFVSIKERMNNLPVGEKLGICPKCNAKLAYPKLPQTILKIWSIYIIVLILSFLIGLGITPILYIFSYGIYLAPALFIITVISFAWGMKLYAIEKEVI